MEIILTLIISILPVYLIALYIYKKDREKEPKQLLKKLFIYGMISCIPAALIEVAIGPFFGTEENMDLITLFLYVSISIALVEELCKWFITYKVAYNHKEFDQIYDAIVYTVFVSLGFACFENIFYVLDAGVGVGIIRAITAIPGHASDAIIMGNYLGLAKLAEINKNDKLCKKNLLLSILLPTLAHAIYDYCIFTENTLFISLFIGFLIYIYIYSIQKVKKVSAIRENLIHNEIVKKDIYNYCPNCGTKSHGNYCHNCGTNLHITKINDTNNLTQ